MPDSNSGRPKPSRIASPLRVACGAGGFFIGPISLLQRRTDSDGGQTWIARPAGELNAELSDAYGVPVDLTSKMNGIGEIARALNRDDIATAQFATVRLGFPDLPRRITKQLSIDVEAVELPKRLAKAGLLKAEFDEDKHPRWPARAPDSQGGRFRTADAGDASTANQAPRRVADARQRRSASPPDGGPGSGMFSQSYREQNAPEPLTLPNGTPITDPTTNKAIQKPHYVNIQDNIDLAIALRQADANSIDPSTAPITFYFLFRQYGPMDYQRSGSEGPFVAAEGEDRFDSRYTGFASFNLGLMGYWAGIPEAVVLKAAGEYNRRANPNHVETAYGNRKQDEENIKLGYQFAPMFRSGK